MHFRQMFILLLILLFGGSLTQCQLQYCSHPIFCNQTILLAISKSTLFEEDFKQFVDLVLSVPIPTALQSFREDNLQIFIEKNFLTNASYLLPTSLADFNPTPPIQQKIKDPQLKEFFSDLNKKWNQLARKVNLNIKQTKCISQCTSFLQEMDGRVILVPGGRFREGYYWDTFWIVKGLIATGMLDTAESTIRNFFILINKYGFVPNGFRKYYLNRSQPPFLTLMVKDLSQALLQAGKRQKAETLEKDAFQLLIKQHTYWQTYKSKNITIKDQTFKLNVYNANSSSPRPESYRQDLETVSSIQNVTQKKRVLHCLSSIAESGWDFSSRWFKDSNSIVSAAIDQIIPTDLNTIIALNQGYLAKLAQKQKRQDIFTYLLASLKQRIGYFSLIKSGSNLFPDSKPFVTHSIYPSDYYPLLLFPQLKPFITFNSLINPPSSLISTSQQWDKPNVWAPNNWLLHEVLPHIQAFQYAQQWVQTVYCSWKKEGVIYQKYKDDQMGKRGQGGEYKVQTGFGWTNGLVMHYIMLYPHELKAPNLAKCA